ncbi:MAG: hypothetical protein WAK95_22200, partial [Desulfobacterales bacterium]
MKVIQKSAVRFVLPVFAFAVAAVVLAACAAQKAGMQPSLTAAPAAKAYAYSTRIPPGIEVPDTVETSIGTLNLNDGYPDDATTQKVYDNLDASRALQAYLLAIPIVNQASMRATLR